MIKISFITNSTEFTQWNRIEIFKSINTITGTLFLRTMDFYKGKPTNWKIYDGDEYELKINEVSVSKGYIDKIVTDYGIDGYKNAYYTFQLACRDTTSALDSTYDKTENEWKKQTVLNIIRRICSAYGIEVAYESVAGAAVNNKIESFKHNEGDKASDSIIRACSEFGLLPISYGDSKLTITKAATSTLTFDSIEVGANVQQIVSVHSNADRYSSYTVKGIGLADDNKQLKDFIEPSGTAADSVMTTYRPLVIFSEVPTDNGKCQERAKWERNVRAGNSRKKIYRMLDWFQSNKEMWPINRLARVKDWLTDTDKLMLISEACFIYDAVDGNTCQLTVVDKDTYSTAEVKIKGEFDR